MESDKARREREERERKDRERLEREGRDKGREERDREEKERQIREERERNPSSPPNPQPYREGDPNNPDIVINDPLTPTPPNVPIK